MEEIDEKIDEEISLLVQQHEEINQLAQKLLLPYWEVVVHDKHENESWVERYRTKPEPIQWVLDYFGPPAEYGSAIFELSEEDGEYYNRVGDKLSEMIDEGPLGWQISITDNGQDVYGVRADCYQVTKLEWKD